MVIRTKGDAKSAAEPRGIMWLLFGSETWTGDVEIVERYRQCFATTRGLRVGGDRESWSRVKTIRRYANMASFAVEFLFMVLSAVGRGYGLARPCEGSGSGTFNVFLHMCIIGMVALLFAVWTRGPISPLRCFAEIGANLLLAAASFALVLLGPSLRERIDAGVVIQRTALAAAFLVTSCTLLTMSARIFLIRLRRREIIAKSRAEADHRAGVIPASAFNNDDDALLTDLLLPPVDGGPVATAAPVPAATGSRIADLQREEEAAIEIDFAALDAADDAEELLPPVQQGRSDGGAANVPQMSEQEIQSIWASLDLEEDDV
jgi:hypothetical protein